jgi:hypothetical protein
VFCNSLGYSLLCAAHQLGGFALCHAGMKVKHGGGTGTSRAQAAQISFPCGQVVIRLSQDHTRGYEGSGLHRIVAAVVKARWRGKRTDVK